MHKAIAWTMLGIAYIMIKPSVKNGLHGVEVSMPYTLDSRSVKHESEAMAA